MSDRLTTQTALDELIAAAIVVLKDAKQHKQLSDDLEWQESLRKLFDAVDNARNIQQIAARDQREYRKYRGRFLCYREGSPMNLIEFLAAQREWDENYNALWDQEEAHPGSAFPEIQRLEHLLVV